LRRPCFCLSAPPHPDPGFSPYVPPPCYWHIDTFTYTQNCRCLGQQTTGETTSPLLTLEEGKGTTGEGTYLVLHLLQSPRSSPFPTWAIWSGCSIFLIYPLKFWPRRMWHFCLRSWNSRWGSACLKLKATPPPLPRIVTQLNDPACVMQQRKVGNKDEVTWMGSVRQETWHLEWHA
jgi:hypothetical protein